MMLWYGMKFQVSCGFFSDVFGLGYLLSRCFAPIEAKHTVVELDWLVDQCSGSVLINERTLSVELIFFSLGLVKACDSGRGIDRMEGLRTKSVRLLLPVAAF